MGLEEALEMDQSHCTIHDVFPDEAVSGSHTLETDLGDKIDLNVYTVPKIS